MMKENKIDKLFKAKASEGQFAFKEAHWAAAEKMLDAQPRGGGFRFGLMSGLMVVAISVASTLVWFNANQTEITNHPSESSTYSEEPNPAATNLPLATGKNESPIHTKELHQHIENKKELNETRPKENAEAEHNAQQNMASAKWVNTNAIQEPTKEKSEMPPVVATVPQSSPKLDESPTALLANTVNAEEQTTWAGGESTAVQESNVVNNDVEESDFPLIDENSGKTMSAESTTQSHSATYNNEEETEVARSTKNQPDLATESALENRSSPLPGAAITSTETPAAESEEDIEPFKWTDNFTYSLGGEFGYIFNQRQLSASPSYAQFRNQHETQKGSLSGGFSIQLGYRNWLLSTGIYQYVIREDVSYPSSVPTTVGVDESYWSTFQVWNHTIDSTWVIKGINQGGWQVDTNWSVHEDSVFMEQWDSTIVQKENPKIAQNNGIKTIAYAEVPVLFGRSFKMNKLVLDVQAGMSFGFLTRVEGAQYMNQRVTNLATENQIDQFNRVVYSGMLRVGLRYGLSQNLEVGLYPSLRYTINSVLKPTFGDQKYLGYGLQFGLYYRL